MLARLETGVTAINDHLYTHGLSETRGGWKLSGIGRTYGAHGLQEMTHAKVINWDILPAKRNLWWFPFSQDTHTALLVALRFAFPRSPGEYIASSLKLTPYLLKRCSPHRSKCRGRRTRKRAIRPFLLGQPSPPIKNPETGHCLLQAVGSLLQ